MYYIHIKKTAHECHVKDQTPFYPENNIFLWQMLSSEWLCVCVCRVHVALYRICSGKRYCMKDELGRCLAFAKKIRCTAPYHALHTTQHTFPFTTSSQQFLLTNSYFADDVLPQSEAYKYANVLDYGGMGWLKIVRLFLAF